MKGIKLLAQFLPKPCNTPIGCNSMIFCTVASLKRPPVGRFKSNKGCEGLISALLLIRSPP